MNYSDNYPINNIKILENHKFEMSTFSINIDGSIYIPKLKQDYKIEYIINNKIIVSRKFIFE
jgi:hypothetical protein